MLICITQYFYDSPVSCCSDERSLTKSKVGDPFYENRCVVEKQGCKSDDAGEHLVEVQVRLRVKLDEIYCHGIMESVFIFTLSLNTLPVP